MHPRLSARATRGGNSSDMNKRVLSLFTGLVAFANFALAQPARPANPNTNARARAVLEYLAGLEKRSDRRLLSGQFSNFGEPTNLRIIERIQAATGHSPAMLGVDYVDFARGDLTFAAPNQAVIDYWKQGGLPNVSAHLYNPANPNHGKIRDGGLRDQGVDLDTLLAEGSATHQEWMRELDQLAGGLQELKAAGVVVLWRPFHEMNGGWFWWGGHEPEKFIRVWRHMFDYFTKTKGLDNLLWVYGPNHGAKTAAYYPGDAYADIVGLDAYTDFVDSEHIRGYDELAKLPKPFGFTEFGPHGASNPPGDFDYRRLAEGLKKHFPRTVFFHCWNEKWSLASNNHVKELLEDSWAVNLADLPKGLTGDR
jgi:mannan endo-1,4-beta-mannosidase